MRLFWYPDTGEVRLRYDDECLGDWWSIVVDRERALDAFHHPNCYRPRPALVPAEA